MEFLAGKDYSGGFAGPVEAQELKGRLINYIHNRGSAAPAAGDVVGVEVARNFVKFHQGNEVWGDYAGKSFVKGYLIDRLCDFFSYSIEINKRLDEKKAYMLYPQAQQLSLDIFFVGTVLAGLTKGESEELYLALNQMLAFKADKCKLKLGDQPVYMEVIIDSDAFIEGFNPSPGRIRSKVPRITKKSKEQMLADK